jgi:hypothetical protein
MYTCGTPYEGAEYWNTLWSQAMPENMLQPPRKKSLMMDLIEFIPWKLIRSHGKAV